MRKYLFLFFLTSISAVGVTAQQPSAPQTSTAQQPGAVFRAEINFVEVHAIVTDAQGNFVPDLNANDFEIYEDGRLQDPAAFSLINLPIEAPLVPVGSSEPVEADVRLDDATFEGRLYVVLFDDLHTDFQRTRQVRDTARKFIETYFGANDLAAVVYTSGRQDDGQELTNNRRLLLAAIDKFQGRKLPPAGPEKLAVVIRQQSVAETLSDQSEPVKSPEGLQQARDTRDPYDAERGLNARRALDSVEDVAQWLSDVPGRRKALLFFSEGIDYDIYQPFNRGLGSSLVTDAQETFAAAQRANVNVYAIDPRGLNNFGEMISVRGRSTYPQVEYGTFQGSLRELLLAQESLLSLADETGGLAIIRSNDVTRGLAQIVVDNSRYYLLAYYSDSSRWRSGRFMKIDVKVKRPGLRVRARHGFVPPDEDAVKRARKAEPVLAGSQARTAALGKPMPIGDLSMRVNAAPFRGTDSKATVMVTLEIDGASLKFEESDGRFNETIEAVVIATDQRGRVQAEDGPEFRMKLQPKTHELVSQTGVRLLSRLELAPARYQIRVGARETTGGGVAAVIYDLDVPDYSKVSFALSGVLLSSSEAESLATANSDAEFRKLLAGPPVAKRTFSAAETLKSFVEVYDNVPGSAHNITFAMTVQGAEDGRVVFTARDRRSVEASSTRTQAHGFRTDIPLGNLRPGTYVLRAEATASVGAHTAQREVLFQVN